MTEENVSAPSVAIIGGGIAGLAAAWELESSSRAEALSVDVFEATDRFGGPLRTDRASGLVLEGGPDSFLTVKPEALEFCAELGLSSSLLAPRPSSQNAYIYRDGRLHPIPAMFTARPGAAARSLLTSRLLHRTGRARVVLGVGVTMLRPLPTGDSVAVGPALRTRFGREAMDWLVEPLVSGMHPAPIDVLSLAAIDRMLPRRWTTAARGSPSRPSRTTPAPRPPDARRSVPAPFATLRDGMGQLAETVQGKLRGARLHSRKPVSRVSRNGDRYEIRFEDGTSTMADAVIVAVPPSAAARMLSEDTPEASEDLRAIRMADTVVVGMVFDRADVPLRLDGSGILVPRPSNLPISAVTWLSAKWERPDPTGCSTALRVFLRPMHDLPADGGEEDWLERALEGLRSTMGIRARPRHSVVFRHPRALAWYDVEHAARVTRIRRSLTSWKRMEIAGGAYDGIGIPDAIRSGREAAHRIGTAFAIAPVGPPVVPGPAAS